MTGEGGASRWGLVDHASRPLRPDVGPTPDLSEDRRAGLAAFPAERPPRWSGR
ncbi:hypothetical protein [Modestobacter versicolor]|uniref:hypothetical protein n=1 Tax=Modestobacter versicolor TaxID=429133 RepID=UPI0034DE5BE6